MQAPSFTVTVPLIALLLVATVSDMRTRRIPNGLSLGGAFLGLLINAAVFGPAALALAALGWTLCLACFLPLYKMGGTAAGDVKLMAMVGAFLGPLNGFMACVCTLLAGALLASLTVAKRRLATTQGAPAPRVPSTIEKLPYAAAIAAGGIVVSMQPARLTTWLTMVLH